MFAITFDMNIAALEQNFGIPYNPAYYEIRKLMKQHDFFCVENWSDFTEFFKS